MMLMLLWTRTSHLRTKTLYGQSVTKSCLFATFIALNISVHTALNTQIVRFVKLRNRNTRHAAVRTIRRNHG